VDDLEVIAKRPAEINIPATIRREVNGGVEFRAGEETGIPGGVVKRRLHRLTGGVKEEEMYRTELIASQLK